MDHAHEAFAELIVPGCYGAVDFQASEHALDAVALFVERRVMFDLYPVVWPGITAWMLQLIKSARMASAS